ncbi:MAG: YggT family protein [Propionibacteriales bacterium]|nr:YggT family protein [Propionibacteriales bacterium]
MNPVGAGINLVLSIFIGLVLARIVVELIQNFARSWEPRGVVLVLLEGVFSVTDPPINAFRRVFKPLRFGGIALDLAPLLVLLSCSLLIQINTAIW